MGKQVRKTYKPRANPIGNKAEAGVIEGVDQQIVLQPDQVLPVVQKVMFLITSPPPFFWQPIYCFYFDSYLLPMPLREVGLLLVFPT